MNMANNCTCWGTDKVPYAYPKKADKVPYCAKGRQK